MKQTISDTESTRLGYKINYHFIEQFEFILKQSSPQATIEIKVKAGSGCYVFENPAEFRKEIDHIVDAIQEFTLSGHLPSTSIYSNVVTISFDNTDPYSFRSSKISYEFDDEKTYRYLKDKLTSLLKEHCIFYTSIMAFPYYPFAVLFTCVIFPYLSFKKLIPSKYETPLTVFDTVFFIFALFRRRIFPKYEFDFGVNISQNSRAKSNRNFILGGIVFTIVINLVSNFLYDLF